MNAAEYREELLEKAAALDAKYRAVKDDSSFRPKTDWEKAELRRVAKESAFVSEELRAFHVFGPRCPTEIAAQNVHLRLTASRNRLQKVWKEQAEQAVNNLSKVNG